MTDTKTIVCLANSKRPGGFCVAGKVVLGEGCYGEWIRPVNARNDDAILSEDMKFDDGGSPQILDVISIPLIEHTPKPHQQENYRIDSDQSDSSWAKKGALGAQELPKLLDSVPGTLWLNGTWSAKNDCVPIGRAHELSGSLLLIRPEVLTITVDWHPGQRGRRDVIATFRHNHCVYTLKVTDPLAQRRYQDKSWREKKELDADLPRQYSVSTDNVYLCVSLAAKAVGGYCYKLVATIIGDHE